MKGTHAQVCDSHSFGLVAMPLRRMHGVKLLTPVRGSNENHLRVSIDTSSVKRVAAQGEALGPFPAPTKSAVSIPLMASILRFSRCSLAEGRIDGVTVDLQIRNQAQITNL
jgi:hypothetical protein